MRFLVLLAPLLLAACGGGPAPAAPGAQTAAEAECRQQAWQKPEVQALMAKEIPGTSNRVFDFSVESSQQQARDLVQQATVECLRRRGLPAPGGVEAVKRYPFGPLRF